MNRKTEVVYVAHPYGGDAENKEKVEKIIKELVKQHPGVVFISPIHALGFMYEDIPYLEGMHMCLELLQRCDKLLLCGPWDGSSGCCLEHAYSRECNQPIIYGEKNYKEGI